MGLGASARYFAANLAEGIQEVSQEAISYGTKQYYSNLQSNPLLGGKDITDAAISSAVGSQFSAQGFETFMSGFLMGGVVSIPQKLLFQGMPNLYNYRWKLDRVPFNFKNRVVIHHHNRAQD